MKLGIATIAVALLATLAAHAQEFKLAKSTGTLNINEVNNVIIEGTTGNEIIFSSRGRDNDEDDRAKGLRAISSMGLEDNTGLGLSVVDKGGVIEVNQMKKMDGPEVTIKVPKGVKVSYSHTSPHGHQLEVNNFEGELVVSTVHSSVVLNNASGPVNVKTMHGNIDAAFGASLKNAITLTSMHGRVDVALPVATKASLKLETNWGEILVDPDFKIEVERSGELVKYSGDINGKINGGGVEIQLSSLHNNVYLRKK